MTSNLGSSLIRENFERMTAQNRNKIMEETKSEVMELLKKTIRPEFLNRIDETIMFTPLSEREIRQIVVQQLDKVKEMLSGNGVTLTFTDDVLQFIAEEGYDPQFGARPVKRVIQKYVLNPLAKEILGGQVDKTRPIVIDVVEKNIFFKN